MWVRDEYSAPFGRQVLTLWSGSFADQYEGRVWELPRHDGYMVTLYGGRKVRVDTPSPRTDDNYQEVDAAINAAVEP